MQASGMHEEVDAIKKQLKLLGHTVPTNVIVNFLQNNNQLFPSYAVEPTSQPLPRSPTSLQHTGSVHDRAANQPHYLPESSTLPPNCMQQAAAHTPQLDTAWAGPGSASLYDGANDQVRHVQADCMHRASSIISALRTSLCNLFAYPATDTVCYTRFYHWLGVPYYTVQTMSEVQLIKPLHEEPAQCDQMC